MLLHLALKLLDVLFVCSLALAFTYPLRTGKLVAIHPITIPSKHPKNLRTEHALKDILGLGAPEIAICLVAGLVLFGPETLKSLSKDFGKAAAELKEIPKTFKEGMDEGSEAVQVSKMKAIAAAKRKKRDDKLAQAESDVEGKA